MCACSALQFGVPLPLRMHFFQSGDVCSAEDEDTGPSCPRDAKRSEERKAKHGAHQGIMNAFLSGWRCLQSRRSGHCGSLCPTDAKRNEERKAEHVHIKDSMSRTFASRRQWIATDLPSVSMVMDVHPALTPLDVVNLAILFFPLKAKKVHHYTN